MQAVAIRARVFEPLAVGDAFASRASNIYLFAYCIIRNIRFVVDILLFYALAAGPRI